MDCPITITDGVIICFIYIFTLRLGFVWGKESAEAKFEKK